MATEIKLPELGENIEEGEVVDVKVAVGAEVKQGQAVLEVEAEKSTVEVPSPSAGRISQMLVKKGDKVKTGQALFLLETGGTSQPPPTPTAKQPAPAAAASQPTTAEGAAPQPPKAPPPVQAAPTLAPAVVASAGNATALRRQDNAAAAERVVPAGPATRRLARELGIDLALVHSSAPGGRVTQEDVKAFVRDLAAGATAAAPAAVRTPALPDFGKWGPIERKPMDAVRRKTAEQMAVAWSQIPHVTQHDLADITELESFRKQQDGRGPKLTITAFTLKATIDLGNHQLILKQYYHLGIAVDTERGLLVPVLRDVDKKSVQELAKEMAEVADRARQKKVTADELRGGTFTITNLGGIGGTYFTPIINWPEVAILGLSRSRLQPVFQPGGQVTPRLMLPLSLSYDHRVIDGADAARFVRHIVEMLENPLLMLLDA
jgi:pyruvate dehydrogenase E2 component (dihydrolipoamide acetyltransferase)